MITDILNIYIDWIVTHLIAPILQYGSSSQKTHRVGHSQLLIMHHELATKKNLLTLLCSEETQAKDVISNLII